MIEHDRKKNAAKKRHCIGDCNFAAYYGSQVGHGLRDITTYRGRSYQRGYGIDDINIYRGRPYQRGHGIGTVIRRIGIPMLKFLGRHLLPAGVAVGSDLINKRSIKESLRERGAHAFRSAGREGVDRIASMISQQGSGRVYKRKRKKKISKKATKKRKTTKKRRSRDIFNKLSA